MYGERQGVGGSLSVLRNITFAKTEYEMLKAMRRSLEDGAVGSSVLVRRLIGPLIEELRNSESFCRWLVVELSLWR